MSPVENDIASRKLLQTLGLRQGLLIGFALALGALAPHALGLSTARARGVFFPFLLGLLALMLLGSLAGWLAALRESALWSALVWLLAAVAMIWVIGHLPYEGRNLTIWLTERRFWGLPVFAFTKAAQARLLMAGFFVVLCLTFLGLLQNYRLEGIASETSENGRLSGRAWFLLLLPLPLVFAAGFAADNLVNSPERTAHRLVHEAIRTGRTYEGDLFELSLKKNVNYNAIAGVRAQMSADYSLSTGEVRLGASNNIVVVADFDNGAWINCQVGSDQLFHCYDASLPYLQGFPSLLTEGETPEDCLKCTIKAEDEQRTWLLARSERWTGSPQATRLAQAGSYVLMKAQAPNDDYAVECLFQGISPVTLERCREVNTDR
jgi:hypothetical protein